MSLAAEPDVQVPATPEPPLYQPTVIEPSTGWSISRLAELWQYREVLYYLIWRDVKVRYRQTALGVAWVVAQPVLNMILFTILFGRVAHLPSDGVPYSIFTFAALLPWSYFASVMQQATLAIVNSPNMITKVYVPRLAFPVSATLGSLVDLAAAAAVLVVLMLVLGVHPGVQVVALPVFLLLVVATALGVGTWLAALNVQYRDVKYVVPFLSQVWLFASPVAYSAHLVKGKLALVYALNPMASVVEGFRWCLLGVGSPDWSYLPSVAVAFAILVSGVLYFQRVEQKFADVI
ncbi:MAG: ABC transporter permease [Chloroflexi bacterium]|nr:ABC transporter permease [Chloroflexota bacterium]